MYDLQQKTESFINVSNDVDLDVALTKKRPPVVEIRLSDTVWVGDYDVDDKGNFQSDKLIRTGFARHSVILRFGSRHAYEDLKTLHEQLGKLLADSAWNKIKKELAEEDKNQEAIDVLNRMASNPMNAQVDESQ
jgi:hypothetical protein